MERAHAHIIQAKEAAASAIEVVGSIVKVAEICGVTKGAVWQWKRSGVSHWHVDKVSNLTGIPKHKLRPDLFEETASGEQAA